MCIRDSGLNWQLPLACPEWRPAPVNSPPDVVVRYGPVPSAPPSALAAGPLRQVTPEDACFGLPDVARLLVRGGNEIVIERREGADNERVRLLLLGTGTDLLLHQRGLLPLHASSILTPAGAVLFMGHSGAGKSTPVSYTHLLYDTSRTVGPKGFGDETEFAAATAAFCGTVDHVLLNSAQVTPMAGIHRMLAIMPEPAHAAGNFFWITDLLEQARAAGLGTLLTGQGGNATVSWHGAPELRSRLAPFRYGGWKAGLRHNLPLSLLRPLMRLRAHGEDWSDTAIHPDFARRMTLSARCIAAMGQDVTLQESWGSPRDKRYAIMRPGAGLVGDLGARQGAAAGLEVRDPTLDQRVMAYTLAVPDAVFDAEDGMDRWLMRQAMTGLLPETVRLNERWGRQSADVAGRLLASAAEVEAALAAVASSPANGYLDVAKMRRAWADVQQEVTIFNTHRVATILLRGLMAGLFLNLS